MRSDPSPGPRPRFRPRTGESARRAARLGGLWVLLLLAGLSLVPSVSARVPAPAFTVTMTVQPDHGDAPLVVTFSASVLSGTPTWYSWNFGDGSYENGTAAKYQTVAHTYTEAGDFDATVTADESSGTATASHGINVSLAPLVATATATPSTGNVPVTVSFVGSVTGGSGSYAEFQWDFGNGHVGTGNPVNYTYTVAGHYHVEFNATDTDGNFTRAFVWVNLTGAQNVTAPGKSSGASTLELVLVAVGAFGAGAVLAGFLLLWRGRRSEPEPPAAAEPEPVLPATSAEPPPEPTAPPSAPAPVAPEVATTSPVADAIVAPTAVPEEKAPPSPPKGGARSAPSGLAPKVEHETLRVSERIVVHLATHGVLGPDAVAPVAFSQAGMAEALGIRQNALTNVLRRLEAAGILTVDVRHVEGKSRRMKVYRLTTRGESLARDLRRRAGEPAHPRLSRYEGVADPPE